jgi:enoyl-CoA hydratase/carnithine racemase
MGDSCVQDAPFITIEREGAVALLTLSRPQSRNSLSEGMMAALQGALEQIGADTSLRAVILAADGPVFCAGHDLKQLTARRADPDGGQAYFTDILGRCAALMRSIVALPQPVIAAVHGTATAAGCQLVASCDLALATPQARFCTPGVNIGLFCSTRMVALSRNVSRKHAMEMLLTGEMVEAETAARMGLINRVVAPDMLLGEARDLAQLIASKAGPTLRTGKAAFYRQDEMGLEDAYAYASRVMVDNLLAVDAIEGMCAFIDKRPPVWSEQ